MPTSAFAQFIVTSSVPADGAVNVPLTTTVSLTFNAPLDTTVHFTEESRGPVHFVATDPPDSFVLGDISYSADLRTISVEVTHTANTDFVWPPGAGYTERTEWIQGSSGEGAGVAVEDRSVASPLTVAVNGSFSGTTDWAAIGLELKPQALAKQLAGTGDMMPSVPSQFNLQQNYPNPFNPTTTIEFAIPQASDVTLKIYNLRGEEVATLVSERLPPGNYKREWSAEGLSSGVYFYRLQAGTFVETRKLLLVK